MNPPILPPQVRQLQSRIQREVSEFLMRHDPQDAVLVLDSTGPSVTRHYLVLSAIGRENVLRFKEIHAFSGGAFAIFGFLGLTSQQGRFPLPELRSPATERLLRQYHHPRRFSVLRTWLNLARRRSAFGSNQPVASMLAHIFSPEYLAQPYEQFAAQVVIHLGWSGASSESSGVSLSNGPKCHPACLPLRQRGLGEVVTAAVTVPWVYGRADGKDEFFDPVYAPGYRAALKEASRTGHPTLVSTPWRSGSRGDIQFVNCFAGKHQKLDMFKDFLRLTLNLPNHHWGDDLYAAFEAAP